MRITLAFVCCVLIWGSTWYAIELQLGVVAKEWSLVYRFALASLVLFCICLVRRDRLIVPRANHIWMASTGLFMFSATYIFTYTGAEYLTSGLVAVTFSLLSFFNILNARIFLKNKIQPTALAAALLGIVGLALIFKPEVKALSFEDQAATGVFFCVIAAVVCSFGNTIAGAPASQNQPLLPFNAWGLGYGALFNLIYAVSVGAPIGFDPRLPYVVSLIYLAVAGTVVAFTLFIWLIDKIGLGRTAYMSVLIPVVALIISTFLEDFVWTAEAFAGLALVVGGNILMIQRKPKTGEKA